MGSALCVTMDDFGKQKEHYRSGQKSDWFRTEEPGRYVLKHEVLLHEQRRRWGRTGRTWRLKDSVDAVVLGGLEPCPASLITTKQIAEKISNRSPFCLPKAMSWESMPDVDVP